ncbi:MAG: GNAT family N-acetyltransferase [Clostridia bacterium]|nr:GNAT family N-acetyltransferase [Clostridia bacterium]
MIRILDSLDPYWDFINEVNADPAYSEPMIGTPENLECNLIRALDRPEDRVLGVFENGEMTGLFVFSEETEISYMEMLVGLSRSDAAYAEIEKYLRANYPGWQVDFVFNPGNEKLLALLEKLGAEIDTEQQRMVLADGCVSGDTEGIEPLSEKYREQYFALHSTDCYWTGERVAEAADRFRALLAVDNGAVVGYIDFTHAWDENEIFDLLVSEKHRGKGWGRKLVLKALELNSPKAMMLMVEVDNIPALRLYDSVGFKKVPGMNSRYAAWHVD